MRRFPSGGPAAREERNSLTNSWRCVSRSRARRRGRAVFSSMMSRTRVGLFDRTTVRSASCSARRMSWVTKTTVLPSRAKIVPSRRACARACWDRARRNWLVHQNDLGSTAEAPARWRRVGAPAEAWMEIYAHRREDPPGSELRCAALRRSLSRPHRSSAPSSTLSSAVPRDSRGDWNRRRCRTTPALARARRRHTSVVRVEQAADDTQRGGLAAPRRARMQTNSPRRTSEAQAS